MCLASRVLNRQLMAVRVLLRSRTRASISRERASSLGSRCFRQERDRTLNTAPLSGR